MGLPKQEGNINNENINRLYELTYQETNKCIQCGYCLPVCPTYKTMGKETTSPRGRINLVKQASLGNIDISEHLAAPIESCVGCRACEVACPVGVPYGYIQDSAKQIIAKVKKEQEEKSTIKSKLTYIALNKLLPKPNRLRRLGTMVWLYQKSGVYKLVSDGKVINKISEPLAQLEQAIPVLEAPSKRYEPGTVIKAKGKKRARIAFFLGCVSDAVFYRTNRLSIELLSLVGCEVVIPQTQKCCGAIHKHQGQDDKTKELAKGNIEAFESSGADFYINNAGGCGAMLSEYDELLKDEEDWAYRAEEFVKKSKDISQILVDLGPLPFKKEWNGIITYQDSCHLRNVQGVYKEPRQLLQSIPGANYQELAESHICCGSGGIYNILHFNDSMKILDFKMKNVKYSKAKTVVTTNPGCFLQMNLGVKRHGLDKEIKTLHLVDLLADVCGIE